MRLISWVVLFFAATGSVSFGYDWSTNPGDGSEGNPYQIWTSEQLNAIGANSDFWNKHFKLTANIDMSVYTGTQYNIIGNINTGFTGTFDGNSYAIRNLTYMTNNAQNCVGLFGRIEHAVIRNINLENVTISSDGEFIGGLVGWNKSGTIVACYATGSVHGDVSVGGLVGSNSGYITSSYAAAEVSGYDNIGGLAGYSGTISTTTAGILTESIKEEISEETDPGEILSCYATGNVIGNSSVGGLVGASVFRIAFCYAQGNVFGHDYVGGLVGGNFHTIASCYSTGKVSGNHWVGGLVGENYYGSIEACFWDKQTSQTDDGVGQVHPDPAGIAGKTTLEMFAISTFTAAGWDFSDTDGDTADWWMPSKDYPSLKWQQHYGAGCGTLEDPYQIQAPWHMNSIGLNPCDWNKHFILMADIDMSFYTGTQYNIIGNSTTKFTGSFDGNGHIIRNLTYTKEGVTDCVGLFGRIENASIKNLGLIDVVLYSGTGNVGGLVGWNDSGALKACYVTGSIWGTGHIGGLVGRNNAGSLTACCTLAAVSGTSIVGGLAGGNYAGSILNCYANCSIRGTGNYVGGLTGYNSKGTLAASYASGIFDNTGSYVGGLAGWNSADAIVSSCFWDTQTSSKDKGVGGGSSGGMTGKITAEMQTLLTFTSSGWDFTNETANGNRDIWRLCTDGKDYPKLSWQSIDGDSACPDGVAVEDLLILATNWMSIESLDPAGFNYACDSNQNGIIGIEDLAALSQHWIKPEVITSKVEACRSAPADTLAAASCVPFTATVQGSHIIFDHAIEQNCCISGIQLNVVQEPGRIILEETITWNMLCLCICTFPTHAELGPFVPGEYVFEVVQIHDLSVYFVGETTVVIE